MPTLPPTILSLKARVLKAERHLLRSRRYRTARLLVALGALAHFLIVVCVLPVLWVRWRIEADHHDVSALLLAYGIALVFAVWGCARTVQLWLHARLWLAGRFNGLRRSAAPQEFDERLLSDVTGSLVESPLAPTALRRLRELRESQVRVEQELDVRLSQRPHLSLQATRGLLRFASVLVVGLSFFAGVFGMFALCQRLPEGWPTWLSAELRLALGGVVWITAGIALGYAAYHGVMHVRGEVSRRMLATLEGAPTRSKG